MRILILLLIISMSFPVSAQFQDDFSDGDFSTNPIWQGNENNFIVNTDLNLQLNDEDASESSSQLFTAAATAGIANWEFWVRQDFSPSSSNFSRIYLASNSNDLNGSLNGYYIQVGGISGSDDALELYKQTGTSSELLISGEVGGVGDESIPVRVRVERDDTGNWELLADYTGGTNFVSQGTAQDATHNLGSFFGIVCNYTATRSDKFFFDDFMIDPLFVDTAAPELISATDIAADKIDLLFNEPINSSNLDINQFSISGGLNITQVEADNTNSSLIHLTLDNEMTSGEDYTIEATNISDSEGNIAALLSASISYFVPETADVFDILINEIMADPNPPVALPDAEFVELYNRSDKNIDLKDFGFASGGAPVPLPSYLLQAGAYVVLTDEDNAALFLSSTPVIALNNFPALTNGGDEAAILDDLGNILHSVNYTADWYQDGVKSDGGWSLELINPESPCQGANNWIASENLSGGTPGLVNSVLNEQADNDGPNLLSVFPQNENAILLVFDEGLEPTFANSVANYMIDSGITISNASFASANNSSVLISLSSPLQLGTTYTISYVDLEDCIGNSSGSQSMEFALPDVPLEGEIVINEILFNPRTGGVDFLELYNNSQKVFNLNNLIIGNITLDNTSISPVQNDYLLFPGSYVVITESPANILENYTVENPNALFENDLPSFNNDEGNITIYRTEGINQIVLDVFDYTEDYHYELLDDEDGVSLERIDPNGETQSSANWHSAASIVGFATPTYKNSQFLQIGNTSSDLFSIPEQVFSPDNDGFQDFLLVQYKTDQNGYQANIRIYDSMGRIVKNLIDGESLSTEGSLKWDGITNEGTSARMGIYVLWVEAFEPGGTVTYFKENFVLAKRLE